MTLSQKRTLVVVAGAALALLGRCASTPTTKYLHPNADLSAIKKVAVLPFENLSGDRSAGDKVQKIFLTELLSFEAFDVVEPGQVAKLLRSERIESLDTLGPPELKKIGEALKVQGLFMGSVVDYADSRSGSTPAPDVTIQLRLIEVQSGVTIWSASRTRSGATTSAKLFGVGGQSLTQAARQLIKEELGTLMK